MLEGKEMTINGNTSGHKKPHWKTRVKLIYFNNYVGRFLNQLRGFSVVHSFALIMQKVKEIVAL